MHMCMCDARKACIASHQGLSGKVALNGGSTAELTAPKRPPPFLLLALPACPQLSALRPPPCPARSWRTCWPSSWRSLESPPWWSRSFWNSSANGPPGAGVRAVGSAGSLWVLWVLWVLCAGQLARRWHKCAQTLPEHKPRRQNLPACAAPCLPAVGATRAWSRCWTGCWPSTSSSSHSWWVAWVGSGWAAWVGGWAWVGTVLYCSVAVFVVWCWRADLSRTAALASRHRPHACLAALLMPLPLPACSPACPPAWLPADHQHGCKDVGGAGGGRGSKATADRQGSSSGGAWPAASL